MQISIQISLELAPLRCQMQLLCHLVESCRVVTPTRPLAVGPQASPAQKSRTVPASLPPKDPTSRSGRGLGVGILKSPPGSSEA